MAEIIRMPEVMAGAKEASIQAWLVEPGTAVSVDQPLAEIETEKAIVELTAEIDGTIGRLLAVAGESVAVGDAIIVLLSDGETDTDIDKALSDVGLASASHTNDGADGPSRDDARSSAGDLPVVTQPVSSDTRRIFASPLVRRLAAQHEIALSELEGTGPRGRIVRRDLQAYLQSSADRDDSPAAPTVSGDIPLALEAEASVAQPATVSATPALASGAQGPAAYEDVPLDRMRRAIARRLTESKSTVPHFYLSTDCRVDALLALRGQVNQRATRKVSVNDFVVKAVAAALQEVPTANAVWNEDSIRRFDSVDLSVAVATDGGLTTPVLRGVERMTLTQISASIADLAERGRAGRLKQQELEGGSFSVSNLGMYGVTEFSAILNPPQAGILAVGAARAVPVVDDGALGVGTVITVTLSADHRVIDGAVAAQWLAAFKTRVENPLTILI